MKENNMEKNELDIQSKGVMENADLDLENTTHKDRYGRIPRGIGAVIGGILTGIILIDGLMKGFSYYFPEENGLESWGIIFWGEHWAIRVAASWITAIGVGFITGLAARHNGILWAAVAEIPDTFIWMACTIAGWTGGKLPFMAGSLDVDISIGNKLAATIIALTIIPVAVVFGRYGEGIGQEMGPHFDSRRHSFLGIKWYHFIWLPFFITAVLMEASYSCLYGLQWVKILRQSFISIIPEIFTIGIWFAFIILGNGLKRCYEVLAGLEYVPSLKGRTFAVLKYGFGYFFLFIILQQGIMYLHYGLSKLFG